MNNHPSKSIGIHQELGLQTKFRKKRASILKIYTVDVFPKSQPVHHQASPPIVVLQGSVPMATTIHPINPTTVLSEPFVDLIDEIEQATNLSEERRRHWVCSLRQIAKSLDRPAEVIPARWSAIRIAVGQLHHARVGVTAKTLANHKSNVKAALRFYQKARATPAWCTIDPRLGQVSWGPGFHVLERVSNVAPVGLRRDLDEYFAGLAQVHRTLKGKRIQACSPATIATRRAATVQPAASDPLW